MNSSPNIFEETGRGGDVVENLKLWGRGTEKDSGWGGWW